MLNRPHALALAALILMPPAVIAAGGVLLKGQPALMTGFGVALILAIVVPLNVWYYRHRNRMTPEGRAMEDASPELERLPGGWR